MSETCDRYLDFTVRPSPHQESRNSSLVSCQIGQGDQLSSNTLYIPNAEPRVSLNSAEPRSTVRDLQKRRGKVYIRPDVDFRSLSVLTQPCLSQPEAMRLSFEILYRANIHGEVNMQE